MCALESSSSFCLLFCFVFFLQTAIDAFYDTSGGHEEDIPETLPVEETRPPSPGPAIAGTIHPLASKPAGKP